MKYCNNMYLAIVIQLSIIYIIQSAGQTDGQACNSCCQAGIPGIHGNHGNPGAPGSIGIKGDNGLKGDHGLKGDMGNEGDMGNKGDHGLKGEMGNEGDMGNKGDHGLKGEMGNNGLDGLPGKLGPIGPQGNGGPSGVNGEKGERGEKGEQPTGTTNQNKSAFTVAFKSNPGRHAASPMKYETIITNVGNHYDKETGKFVCEFPGIYIFQVTSTKSSVTSGNIVTRIMKNGQLTVSAWVYGGSYNSASTMVVLELVIGDQIWTQPASTIHNYYYSDRDIYCTFSGFLLYAS